MACSVASDIFGKHLFEIVVVWCFGLGLMLPATFVEAHMLEHVPKPQHKYSGYTFKWPGTTSLLHLALTSCILARDIQGARSSVVSGVVPVGNVSWMLFPEGRSLNF
jgi:hypothetical protein